METEPGNSWPRMVVVCGQIGFTTRSANIGGLVNCSLMTNPQLTATAAKQNKKNSSRDVNNRKLAIPSVTDKTKVITATTRGSVEPNGRGASPITEQRSQAAAQFRLSVPLSNVSAGSRFKRPATT